MQLTTRNSSASGHAADSPAEDLQLLLVRLGGRTYALPLEHVVYVAKMPVDFSYHGPDSEDYFVFEDTPLTYVSLWDKFGQKSEFTEYEDIQASLPLRQQEHHDWMDALEDSLRHGTSFSKARNPHECAFGKWFYGYHAKDRRLSLLLSQFEHPHAMIHSLADKLLGEASAGKKEQALETFDEAKSTTLASLMRLFDSVQALVIELQRRIVVIVADGDDTCALGADSIRDIVSVPADRIKKDVGETQSRRSNLASTLVILEDSNVVPLLNWNKLCKGETA